MQQSVDRRPATRSLGNKVSASTSYYFHWIFQTLYMYFDFLAEFVLVGGELLVISLRSFYLSLALSLAMVLTLLRFVLRFHDMQVDVATTLHGALYPDRLFLVEISSLADVALKPRVSPMVQLVPL